MKIHIHNTIQMAGETEIINEIHEGQWTVKADCHYLVYINQDGEKVVLKMSDEELVMNRFSTPKSSMRFTQGDLNVASIPTPLGVQRLVTQTFKYNLDLSHQKLSLTYNLLSDPESPDPLASYKMVITWR